MPQFEPIAWPIRIGLIGDTHVHAPDWRVPRWIDEAFDGVDLIVHVGDVCHPSVLEALARIAPVQAVVGNNDPPELQRELPSRLLLQSGDVRIGVIHGHQPVESPWRTARARAEAQFAGFVQVGIYGHSHWPEVRQTAGTLLLVNPGSPLQPRRSQRRCVGVLSITETVAARLIDAPPLGIASQLP